MTATLQLSNDPEVSITVKRTRRARRLSLRVSAVDGRVTLTLPPHISEREARAFVDEKSDWIRDAVARSHAALPVTIGGELPIAGHPCQIVEGPGRSACLSGGRITAPATRPGPAIRALVKHLARARLGTATQRFADALGARPGRLSLRDARSRWGSCTSEGNLMFSWRLALAPIEVLDYVAAHEVAHLRYMDHSPQFWDTVATLYPDFQVSRDWLRSDGMSLHRYRFDSAD